MRHRARSFYDRVWTSCGVRADNDNVISVKSAIVTCPVCLKKQAEERALAKARLKEMLDSPRKGPLRLPRRRPATRAYQDELSRFWSPTARRKKEGV